MESKLVHFQEKSFGPNYFTECGREYRITAHVHWDDRCGNGKNYFSITATIERRGVYAWVFDSGGCCHEDIKKHFPGLAPLIKWHLCASDGPRHYIESTLFFAGTRDCWGYEKGEQKRDRAGKLMWQLVRTPSAFDSIRCQNTRPEPVVLQWEPIVGEGKARDLDAARNAAIWPDAPDDVLCLPREELRAKLLERLPALLKEFRTAVESVGFTW